MKAFYTLILLVFLASCGSEVVTDDTAVQTPDVVQETVVEIDQAVEALPDTQEVVDDLIQEVNSVPLTEEDNIDDELEENEISEEKIVEVPVEEQEVAAEEQASTKVVELSRTYDNPKMEVIMNIEYSLDEQGKISEIALTSPNYGDMGKYNNGVQGAIGLTVEEASEYVISGSSLATPAFQAALKESL